MTMLLLSFCGSVLRGQGIAINDTGAPPNPHALLDVDGRTGTVVNLAPSPLE